MLRYQIEPGDKEVLRLQAPDASFTNLYPQISIYNSSGSLIETVDLTHVANGLYTYLFTAGSSYPEGKYYTQGLFYSDSGHAILADVVQPDSDAIDVSHYKFRPSFGSTQETQVVVKELTDEEIEKISNKLFSRIYPELIKEKKVNVKVDDRKIDSVKNEIISKIGIILNKIPKEIDYRRIFEYQDNLDKKSIKFISSLIADNSSKNEIKLLTKKLSEIFYLANEIDKLIKLLDNVSNIKNEFSDINSVNNNIKELDNKLVKKDYLDNIRINKLLSAIKDFKDNNDSNIRNSMEFLVNQNLNQSRDEI